MHGMPMAVSLGEDNIENKVNDLDYETIELWEMLKNVGGIAPKLEYRDIMFIALRDYEEQEAYLLKKNKVNIVTTAEF